MAVDDQIAIVGSGNQGKDSFFWSFSFLCVVKKKSSLISSHRRYAILVSLAGGQRHGRFARARQRVVARHQREPEYAFVWARQRQGWYIARRRWRDHPGEWGGGEQLLQEDEGFLQCDREGPRYRGVLDASLIYRTHCSIDNMDSRLVLVTLVA